MAKELILKDEALKLMEDYLTPELFQRFNNLSAITLDDTLIENSEPRVEMAVEFYDTEEIYHNCTVHVWSNSKTGAVSIGWTQDNDEGDNDDEKWYDWRDS